jgi:hypothetical protein
MQVFSQIRQKFVFPIQSTLGNVTANGTAARTELARRASLVKLVSGIATVVGALLTLTHLVAAVSFPVFGILGLLFWGLVAVGGHEVFAMSNNVEKMTSSWTSRFGNALSQTKLITSILENTWILGPFFGDSIQREMSSAT